MPLIRFTALGTGSVVVDHSSPTMPPDESERWTGGFALARRIMAFNILPLALLAGGFFYLDGFRSRLIGERVGQTESEAVLIARAIGPATAEQREGLVRQPEDQDRVRFRLVNASGRIVFDSWKTNRTGFINDPVKEQGWQRKAARWLDEAIDFVTRAEVPPPFPGFAATAQRPAGPALLTLGPDRSHIISVKQALPADPDLALVVDRNARDIRRLVRSERESLGFAVGLALLSAILLSLFLARTIVKPLRQLAVAANQVRFGQARDVAIPSLPERRDEIGMLAKAVSDMTSALRSRIDAIEAFAADVSHELKNPLASLGSAVETLGRVQDPALQRQLLAVIQDDVRRADRLITDISDLSRVDARLGRIQFKPVDFGALVESLVTERSNVDSEGATIAFARPAGGSVVVMGDSGQLSRVILNLLDNARSFAPRGSVIRIGATRTGGDVLLTVDDAGPGIPPQLREAVFERFHSNRPDEDFGRHSGLGLAIVRAIVDAHHGSIQVEDGSNGKGTRMVVRLPAHIGGGEDG